MKEKTRKVLHLLSALGLKDSISFIFKMLFSRNRTKAKAEFMADYTKRRFLPIMEKWKSVTIEKSPVPKRIFFFWWDGPSKMPVVPRLCYQSLRFFYPEYEILFIDKSNVENYVSRTDIVYRRFLEKTVTIQNFSDYLRMTLIETLGGYWVDSTLLFLTRFPLESMLADNRSFGSAYGENNKSWRNLGEDHYTWNAYFIAGRKGSPVAGAFLDCFRKHYEKKKYPYDYFMVDDLLDTIRGAKIGEDALNRTIEIDGDFDSAMKENFLLDLDNQKEWEKCPQKLNWRVSLPEETVKEIEEILQRSLSRSS